MHGSTFCCIFTLFPEGDGISSLWRTSFVDNFNLPSIESPSSRSKTGKSGKEEQRELELRSKARSTRGENRPLTVFALSGDNACRKRKFYVETQTLRHAVAEEHLVRKHPRGSRARRHTWFSGKSSRIVRHEANRHHLSPVNSLSVAGDWKEIHG